jgi:hypothetical protein
MGQAVVHFHFDDGEIRYGRYWGNRDSMWHIMDKEEAVVWPAMCKREPYESEIEDCKHEPEHVLVHNFYGSELWWHGEACRTCNVYLRPIRILDGDSPTFEPVERFRTESFARAARKT